MANDDSTRPVFDLSPWKERDPLSVFQASMLWVGIPPTLNLTPENKARYSLELTDADSWLDALNSEVKSGRLAIQGPRPTKQVQTGLAVRGSQYLGTPSRPATYREVETDDWRSALVALADLRAYAEPIRPRPAFFFPDAEGAETKKNALERYSAPASGTEEPPQGWRNGLKRMAWEEARKLISAHHELHGPTLWAAMSSRDDVRGCGQDSGKIEPKTGNTAWIRGEARISKTQVQNQWRKALADLLQ